jgi:hypothetical protein
VFDDDVVVAGLSGVEPACLDGPALAAWVVRLERVRAAVDAASTAAVGEFDRRGLCQVDGVVTTAAWLAHRGRMSGAVARERVKVARALPWLPVVRAAFAAGRMSFEEVGLFARARVPATAAAMEAHETGLVEATRRLRVDDVGRVLQRWRSWADADGAEPAAAGRLEAARLGDRVVLSGELDAVDGEIVLGHLDALCEDIYEAEKADGVLSSPAQRRAAALVEMARRSAGATGKAAATPLITLVVRAEDLAAGRGATTDRGDLVPDPALRRLLCDSSAAAVVLDALGEPVDLGRKVRTASPAQRRALVVRDRGCVFPGCDRPPGWCQAHHLRPWDSDGPTDLANLALLCARHHHLVHEGGWTIRRTTDPPEWDVHRPDGTRLDPDPAPSPAPHDLARAHGGRRTRFGSGRPPPRRRPVA